MLYKATTAKFLEALNINQKDIGDKLDGLKLDLVKLGEGYTNIQIKVQEVSDKVTVQNSRVSKLENAKYFLIGALAILSGIAAYVFAHVFIVAK